MGLVLVLVLVECASSRRLKQLLMEVLLLVVAKLLGLIVVELHVLVLIIHVVEAHLVLAMVLHVHHTVELLLVHLLLVVHLEVLLIVAHLDSGVHS